MSAKTMKGKQANSALSPETHRTFTAKDVAHQGAA